MKKNPINRQRRLDSMVVGKVTIQPKTPEETTVERLGLTPKQVADARAMYERDGFLAFLELYGHYLAVKEHVGKR